MDLAEDKVIKLTHERIRGIIEGITLSFPNKTKLPVFVKSSENPDINLPDNHKKVIDANIVYFRQMAPSLINVDDTTLRNIVKKIYHIKNEDASDKDTDNDSRPEIRLPHPGKLISVFAAEVADAIKDKKYFFFRTDSKDIVEISKDKNGEVFKILEPNRFLVVLERYLSPFTVIVEDGILVRKVKSIGSDLAKTLLESPQIQDSLPHIERIFTFPLPILYEGELTFPKKGYDERFKSWLSPDAPTINEDMTIDEAKDILEQIFKEFCFQKEKDKINAIAALITPFIRGLYSRFNARTPVFFYKANRERAGKDYCAGITGILYEGVASEDAPLSGDDEARKNFLSNMIAGKKRVHFSNNKGEINIPSFEAVITSEVWSDRVLGGNKKLTFKNELEFSLSGNIGVTFTPDLANRCRFINLFLEIEDANSRKFDNPNLHAWVKANREKIFSAFYVFIKEWADKGMPSGKIPFSSFPEWARVCGGIMETIGYMNPCLPDSESSSIDSETAEMKALFELCYAYQTRISKKWIDRNEIITIAKEEEIFSYYDLTNSKDVQSFGQKLSKYINRILSDIRLRVENEKVKGIRRKYLFESVTLVTRTTPLALI